MSDHEPPPDLLHPPDPADSGTSWPDESAAGLSAAERRACYRDLRVRLGQRVLGNTPTLDALALLGTRFTLDRHPGRALLIGPTGSAKTTLAAALAGALDVPSAVVSVADLAERNWQGPQIDVHLNALARATRQFSIGDRQAVLVLDELDKVALSASAVGTSSFEYRRGKQESLLSLLQRDHPIPYSPEGRPAVPWQPHELLIVGTGVFTGLPAGPLHPADFVAFGLMPELVSRFGQVLRLDPPSVAIVRPLLAEAAAAHVAEARRFGLALTLAPATLGALEALVMSPDAGYCLRSVRTLLDAVVTARLAEALAAPDAGEHDAALLITPDDLPRLIRSRPPR